MNKAGRNTKYTKIWRIDNSIKISLWKELISHYYRDNTLIGEYFNGKDDVLLKEHQRINENEKSKSVKFFIPDNLTVNSGICYYYIKQKDRLYVYDYESGFYKSFNQIDKKWVTPVVSFSQVEYDNDIDIVEISKDVAMKISNGVSCEDEFKEYLRLSAV